MWMALLWGALAGMPLLAGALVSIFKPVRKRTLGFVMAFGTGALIAATTFDLLWEDGVQKSSLLPVSIGFVTGALVFTAYDYRLWKQGHRARVHKNENPNSEASGLAIFVGSMLDSIPEAVMIGFSASKAGPISWALFVAIFVSNFPEGLSSTDGFRRAGYPKKKVILTWIAVVVATALSAAGGYYFLSGAPDQIQAIISAFAGGAIIAMLSVTMMPEAYEKANPLVGVITALGLLVSLALNTLK